jgi:hypothetical protein
MVLFFRAFEYKEQTVQDNEKTYVYIRTYLVAVAPYQPDSLLYSHAHRLHSWSLKQQIIATGLHVLPRLRMCGNLLSLL